MSRPTVYLVNLSFGLAGIERRFANIWRALRARGIVRPIMVVPDTLAEILYRNGVAEPDSDIWTVPELPLLRALADISLPPLGNTIVAVVRSRPMAWSYRSIWDRIRADSSAVVHVGMNCSALIPPPVPLVYECVDSTLSQLGTRHYIQAAKRRCIVHCQTDRIRRALEQTMADRHPDWTTVVSPCYFASYFDPPADAPARDPRRIAFVGRLSSEKRPLLFVDAIAVARASGLDIRGLMLGEGPLLAELQRRIRRYNLESVVELGFSDNPSKRLHEAAVFATLQTGDNYGSQSLLEAMGAGCAIIATDVGETHRLVTKDIGVMVPPEVDAVASAIASFVRDPLGTATRGTAASYLARTHYSADAYAGFLESLYFRAISIHGSA